jgi:tetratricopeptide (TPR) repeat protein
MFTAFPRAGAKAPANLLGTLPVADYLDAKFDCMDLRYLPRLYKPRSEWLENETKAYAEILARGKFSWLVVPVQTQYFGFDRIERALMSAEIADAFAGQGNAPSTFLVARALGEVRRRYEPAAAISLSSALGGTRILTVYAGHNASYRMTLTLQLHDCKADGGCRFVKQHDWRDVPFSDEAPPFMVIRGMRDALVREMLGTSKATAAGPAVRPGTGGYDIAKMAAGTTDVETAALSTVIASFATVWDELGRERLQEIALRDALAGARTPANTVRAAHAAYWLNRRPFALKLLEGVNDPAATTLRDLLNGNLVEAQASLAAVRTPDLKLALSFAVEDLAQYYGRPSKFDATAAEKVFVEHAESWSGLVERRASDRDYWSAAEMSAPKRLLDAAFPIPGQDLRSVLRGMRVVGDDDSSESALGIAALRHLRQAQARMTPSDCCSPSRKNSAWLINWLADTLIASNMIKSVTHQLDTQGRPDAAMMALEKYQPYFSGQPDFEALRFRTAYELAKVVSAEAASRLAEQSDIAELSAAYWSQGQNTASLGSALRRSDTNMVREAYSRDFPGRSYWPPSDLAPGQWPTPCDALKYSTANAGAVTYCFMTTSPDRVAALRADVDRRFHGNPQIAAIKKQFMPSGAGADVVAELRAAIAQEPEAWDNYDKLGRVLMERDGNLAEAQKVYLSYPAFRKKAPASRVAVANAAYAAGSEFYWRGQHELARPLYVIAAKLDTGSESSMTSAIRLSLLDGDWESAAEGSLERAMRYRNPFGYRDYLSLLHVLGQEQDARAGFAQVSARYSDPGVWYAQLVDQRMHSVTPEQFKAWILSDSIRDAHYRGRRFAPIYTLWWATTDRKPSADLVQVMRQIEKDARRPVEGDGLRLTRPHPEEDGLYQMVQPSAFRKGKSPQLPPDSNAPSEYILLADALSSNYAGDYNAAVQKFVALADRYPIEDEDTAVALSYFALAAAKTGDKLGLEQYIEKIPGADRSFDVWLSRAFFAAGRKDANKAVAALQRALNVRPHTQSRPIVAEYQYVEACETVLKQTGDARLAPMILDWARRFQRVNPTSAWPYAVEAQYSRNLLDVNRALAMTLYLDPASPRIAKFDAAKVTAARAWLKTNNPFLVTRPGSTSVSPGT